MVHRSSWLRRIGTTLLLITIAATNATAQKGSSDPAPEIRRAGLLISLGTHTYPIRTAAAQAQAFFDQGLRLTYGFYYDPAVVSFEEATRNDAQSPMPWWGVAYAMGPTLNSRYANQPDDSSGRGLRAIKQARELAKSGSAKEQALIDAMYARYTSSPERDVRDGTYAQMMDALARQYPEDLDILAMAAESLMILSPWSYWTPDDHPGPATAKAKFALESVMQRSPDHPFANHLYIHLMEGSAHPEAALLQAERMARIMPSAGHMVHMPAHIYIRLGMNAAAIQANQRSQAADTDFMREWSQNGGTPAHIRHGAHSAEFLVAAATNAGVYSLAANTAKEIAAAIPAEQAAAFPQLQKIYVKAWLTDRRFGKWDELLRLPSPPANLKFVQGMWHYVKGSALRAQGKLRAAEQELAQLDGIAAQLSTHSVSIGPNDGGLLLKVGRTVLAGEIAAAHGSYDNAVTLLEQSVRLEEGLNYDEPSAWDQPPRQVLGRILLDAGRPSEAEVVYWQDLVRTPDNIWSLRGLAESLGRQSKFSGKQAIEERIRRAQASAEPTPTVSSF